MPLITLPRPSDYAGAFLDSVQTSLGLRLDRHEGARWDALAGGMARAILRSDQINVQQFDNGQLDRTVGSAVDDYCRPRGPVRRFLASPAVGILNLARPTAAFGAFTIPTDAQFRVPYAGGSVVVKVTQDWQVGSTDLTAAPSIAAVLTGEGGNFGTVSAGLAVVSVPPAGNPYLLDATMVPTTATVAQGAPGELDPEMKERQRLWEQARQRGTRAAVAFAALLVPGVKRVVLADRNDAHIGGQGLCYVGDRDWNSTDTMLRLVAVSLESWRSFGPSVPVAGISSSDVPVTAIVTMTRPVANYSVTALTNQVITNITNYFNNRADPYAYDLGMLQGRVARAHDEISIVRLTAPAAGVVSPLSPSALALAGFPATLVRYRTSPSIISLTLTGPT